MTSTLPPGAAGGWYAALRAGGRYTLAGAFAATPAEATAALAEAVGDVTRPERCALCGAPASTSLITPAVISGWHPRHGCRVLCRGAGACPVCALQLGDVLGDDA